MNKFRVLIVMMMFAAAFSATAQTTHREAFKAFIKACPSATNLSPDAMTKALQALNQSVLKNYDATKSDQLINNYIKEKFWDDMLDAMMPYVEKNVTVAEINQLTELMTTNEGKIFQEHQAKMNSDLSRFEQMGMEMAQKILAGETPDPIKPVDCPESYKKLYYQFYEESSMSDSFLAIFDNIAGSGMTDEQQAKMNQMKDYMAKSMPTLYLNESYGIMTMDDLKFGLKVYKTTAWKNEMKVVKDISSHAQEMGMGVMMNYITWLQSQGVETNI